tara:strand:- start:1887 stop:2066 length:180 start_codon:yes stop_codon:yes gene_type:complete
MKKPIVKKRTAKFLKKVRPFALPAVVGAAGVSAVLAINKRKKKREQEGKLLVNNKIFKF